MKILSIFCKKELIYINEFISLVRKKYKDADSQNEIIDGLVWGYSKYLVFNKKKYLKRTLESNSNDLFEHRVDVAIYAINTFDVIFPPSFIVAVLLHDTIEDDGVLYNEIIHKFGKGLVFNVVYRLTKVNRRIYDKDFSFILTAEKLLMSLVDDPKMNLTAEPLSILAKLSDRTVNSKTFYLLKSKTYPDSEIESSEARIRRKVNETMLFYQPLAEYFGLWESSDELSNNCLRAISIKDYNRIYTASKMNVSLRNKTRTQIVSMFNTYNLKYSSILFRIPNLYKLKNFMSRDKNIIWMFDIYITCENLIDVNQVVMFIKMKLGFSSLYVNNIKSADSDNEYNGKTVLNGVLFNNNVINIIILNKQYSCKQASLLYFLCQKTNSIEKKSWTENIFSIWGQYLTENSKRNVARFLINAI